MGGKGGKKVPVVGVLDTDPKVFALQGGLHGRGVQHCGSKKGQLRSFIVREEGHWHGRSDQTGIRCQHPYKNISSADVGDSGTRAAPWKEMGGGGGR